MESATPSQQPRQITQIGSPPPFLATVVLQMAEGGEPGRIDPKIWERYLPTLTQQVAVQDAVVRALLTQGESILWVGQVLCVIRELTGDVRHFDYLTGRPIKTLRHRWFKWRREGYLRMMANTVRILRETQLPAQWEETMKRTEPFFDTQYAWKGVTHLGTVYYTPSPLYQTLIRTSKYVQAGWTPQLKLGRSTDKRDCSPYKLVPRFDSQREQDFSLHIRTWHTILQQPGLFDRLNSYEQWYRKLYLHNEFAFHRRDPTWIHWTGTKRHPTVKELVARREEMRAGLPFWITKAGRVRRLEYRNGVPHYSLIDWWEPGTPDQTVFTSPLNDLWPKLVQVPKTFLEDLELSILTRLATSVDRLSSTETTTPLTVCLVNPSSNYA